MRPLPAYPRRLGAVSGLSRRMRKPASAHLYTLESQNDGSRGRFNQGGFANCFAVVVGPVSIPQRLSMLPRSW